MAEVETSTMSTESASTASTQGTPRNESWVCEYSPPSAISRIPSRPAKTSTTLRALVTTVSGVCSTSSLARASAVVESSSITDMPGSTRSQATAAMASFSATFTPSR